jgi:hypothetical protein
MRVTVEQLVEWRLAGKTEVLGENLPQRHSRAWTPGRRGGKPATIRLSYGAAMHHGMSQLEKVILQKKSPL